MKKLLLIGTGNIWMLVAMAAPGIAIWQPALNRLMMLVWVSPFLIGVLAFGVWVVADIIQMERTNFDTMSDEVVDEHFRRAERGEL